MDFRILGSLEVWDGERQLELGGPKRRAVLAYLLLHANEVVAVDRLVDQLWGQKAPRNAAGALHTHVSRLRKELGPEVVARRAWGYVLRVQPGELDLEHFERLIADAESLPARERAAKLREALALWRGPPLEDLAFEPALAGEVARLEDLHLTALENRIDADLEAGDHEGLAAELEALIAAHPLHERLRGQLILALYRSGRQAEALEVYRETRRVLVEELGIEPSPELKELERAILRQDPALAAVPPPQQAAEPVVPIRRWRWPRSPLATGAVLLLLAASGLAAALLLAEHAGSHVNGPAEAGAAASTSGTGGAISSVPASTESRSSTTNGKPPGTTHQRVTTTKAHTTIAVTTTHPTTTHQQPPPSKRASRWVYSIADDFEDPAFDFLTWHTASHGAGVESQEQAGKLHFTIDSSATMDEQKGVDQHYGTMCRLASDFDARVDYELVDWPAQNGLYVGLGVYTPPPHESYWAGTRQGAPTHGGIEAYGTNLGGGVWAETADLKGRLRVRRVRGVVTTYYRHANSWVKLASGPVAGPATLILGLSTNGNDFGGQAGHITFDNFEATAEHVECDGVPLPPRKRVRT